MALRNDWWWFQPEYSLTITDLNGIEYSVYNLATCQANLDVGTAVGQAVITLNDPDWEIWRGVKPRAMFWVSLSLQNRNGDWGQAWAGYVDDAHKIDDSTTGQQVVINCSSPQKLFEVKNQLPSEAASLSLAAYSGVTGSAILRYAAKKVGFPSSKMIIDSSADVGANTWGAFSVGDFLSPSSQSWSSVIQALISDSGLEFFFDAYGRLVYRPVGYLNVSATPMVIDLANVGHYDVGYGDRGVVTEVEVRYGQTPFHVPPSSQNAPYWRASPSMLSALGERFISVTAPYISSNQNGAASYLAKALGQIAAANVATSTIIQVADPLYELGTVIEIPSNDQREGPGLFYLSSKAYNLTYKGPWLEVDGFTYGRAKGQSFPYGLPVTKPVPPTGPNSGYDLPVTSIADVNLDAILTANSGNTAGLGRNDLPFNLVQDKGIKSGTVSADSSLGLGVGSTIQVWTSFTGPTKKPIGDKATYTVVDISPTDGAIHMLNTGGNTVGYVVVVSQGSLTDGTTASPVSAPPGSVVPDSSSLNGTDLATPTGKFSVFPLLGYSLAGMDAAGQSWQEFGPSSLSGEPAFGGYAHFHEGIDLAATPGTTVVSVISGVITSIGVNLEFDAAMADGTYPTAGVKTISVHGYGFCVTVRAGDITTQYAHMVVDSSNYPQYANVKAGTPLGSQDSTGWVLPVPTTANPTAGSHLHFGVFDHVKGQWVNPRPYLQ